MQITLLFPTATNADTPRAVPPVAAELRTVTRAPTRVVWCQDAGDGSDPGAEGTNLFLMGLDTEDSRGERAVLPVLSNYARPMLTPRGDRVIFSNRKDNTIYVVNWDGSGLRRLGKAYAVGVWRDPTSGVEWVYGGTRGSDSTAFHTIQRAPVDQPDRIEMVWNRTLVDSDNFQLSVDGRRAAGAFPWPACGIAELPNRDWKKYGDGCWPSLAPDASGLFWIFDGAHRNLTLFRAGTDERWVVNINHAPGIEGYEVYHPRWSNHPRFMTLTGPYKLGDGDNRIRGGGPGVEIYIGQFDSRFRAMERWVRVTRNTRADFFPDVWIQPEPREARGKPDARPDSPRPESRPATADLTTAWPGTLDGLVFLWENRSKKNEIPGTTGGQAGRVCRAEPRGKARYGRYFEMDLSQGVFIAESGADELLAACRKSNQLSLEAILVPRQTGRPELFQIISFADSADAGNFILGQERDRLVFHLRTSVTNGLSPAIPLCGLTSGVPHHVIVSYAPGHLTCFLNGRLVRVPDSSGKAAEQDRLTGDLSGWTPHKLVFGDRDHSWPGTLEGIALYHRRIETTEAQQKYALTAGRLKNRVPVPPLILEARLTEASKIPTPASISPYRRALIVNRYDNVRVIQGHYGGKQVLAAHWAILDGRVLDTARRQKDKDYRMTLEPFDTHPELEGERQVMDSEEFLLPLYYETE